MRIEGETGFVLHARPWRETSLLVEVLSAGHGRIGGATALMQYFAPCLGRAWIGGRGDALRDGERGDGDDEKAERCEESFDHARDIGARLTAAQP